ASFGDDPKRRPYVRVLCSSCERLSRRSPQSRALSSPMRRRLPDLPGRPTGQAGAGVDVCLFTQEIDERPQRWADMPTTRVVKEEPTEGWRCPIFKYG